MRALLLVIAACHASPPAPASAPVAARPTPQPRGLILTLTGDTLTVRDGDVHATTKAACAAVIDLGDGTREQGVWVTSASGSAALLRLTGTDALLPLHGWATHVSHGLAGSEQATTALLDLDGDRRFELVERRVRHDDTGNHASPPIVYARDGDGPFRVTKGVKSPLLPGDDGPLTKAIGAAMGREVRLLHQTSLGLGPRIGACESFATSPPLVGALHAVASFPRNAKDTLPLTLHVVRAFTSPPQVIASKEIGVLRERFTSDACRVRVRTSRPLLTAQPSPLDPLRRQILAVFAHDDTRRAQPFLWADNALTAGDAVELDACNTAARTPVIEERDGAVKVVIR